jgi:hypothetical protein
MIGFDCPWCAQRAALHPDDLAADSVTCPTCLTQVDLVAAPLPAVRLLRVSGPETERLQAA